MALPPTNDDSAAADAGGADAGSQGMPDAGAGGGDDSGTTVIVTIAKNDDGTYTVYPGDEPDNDAGQSADDIAAGAAGAGGAGAGAGGGGVQANDIGAALKAALDILNEDQSSSGATGSSEDQFNAGFNAGKNPTPATTMPTRQKNEPIPVKV